MFNFLSHIHPQKSPEKLEEHKKLVKEYFEKIVEFKNIDIEKLVCVFEIKDKEFVKKLIKEVIVLHDEGKCNPAFQYLKMKNEVFKEAYEKMNIKSSKHSFLGAVLFFERFVEEVAEEEDDEEFNKKLFLLVSFSFLIAKHHSKLDSFEKFIEELKDELRARDSKFAEFNLDFSYIDFKKFVAIKLIFSLLISSDYYATLEYMAGVRVDDFGKVDIKKAKEEFENYEIIKNIRAKRYKKPIDELRSEIFLEAEKNLDSSKNIFYLQAPTGAGKTLISLNLALSLNPSKIFYVFPFNTLVEQTRDKIEEIFETLDFSVINSITPIKDEEDDKNQYEKTYINRLFYQSPLILTTHVNLFDILFGIGKEDNFALWQLYGSVIILDEIQSYNNNLWWYMAEFFVTFSEVLNLKIIIMSATLPKIDKLLEKRDDFLSLIESHKYFQNPLFKNRVEVDFSMIEKEFDFEEIKEKILSADKVLIEFITRESAREFYEYIKDLKGYEVYELSGDDNKVMRDYVIERAKNAKKIVIVSTQVIEAGVDIDMDIGFKDISVIDSDEQFIGRINRNAINKGKVYFFDKDDESKIYRKDNRISINLRDKKYQKIFLDKDFDKYYDEVLEKIKQKGESYTGIETDIESFKNEIKRLDFKAIQKRMKLINQNNITIFFPYKIPYEGIYKKLLDVDGKFIKNGYFDGWLVWEELKSLNKIENFAKKEIEKSKINYLMQFFTFNVPFYKNLSSFDDECCGIYLIKNYENYIDEDFKFDRKAFLKSQNQEYEFL